MEYDEADLIDMLGEERALDRARLVWAAREARRASGVSWSGMTPALPEGRADADLLEAARAKLAVRRDWRASAQGRFVVAVTEIQAAARAVQATSERPARPPPAAWPMRLRPATPRSESYAVRPSP